MSRHDSRQIADVKILLKTGVDGSGIANIEKTGTEGLVDTYTITLEDGHKYTFTVTNGQSIVSIEKTSTQGLVDTYTILFRDGTTSTFDVTNGNGITSIEKTDTQGLVDTYTITFDNGTTQDYEVTNGRDGGMSAYILITSEAGATVTVTTPSGNVITATQVSGSTTQWECETTEFGSHTVNAQISGQTAQGTVNVDACKPYTITVQLFYANITVTYPSGATCTCVGGSESYTATGSPYTFTVGSADTYTITATNGTATDSETVTITTSGQTETVTLSFVPDGSTVTPTDDIQTWLHCADIWDKSYTTIAQVLADSTTLSALIADANAVDYMVRSTTWASSVCANQTAMSYIGLDDYCANKLLADSTWRSAICNSSYFESVLNAKVPTMTSTTTPSGVVSSSSDYYTRPSWKAFDGVVTRDSSWMPLEGRNNNWIQYQFPSSLKVLVWTIKQYDYSSMSFTAKLQGSNDATSWTDLDTQSLTQGNRDKKSVLSGDIAYSYYKVTIPEVMGQVGQYDYPIMEIQFYGRASL